MTRASVLIGLALGGVATTTALVVAGVKGSKHDFSAEGWSEEQLCLPCHVPHQASATEGVPLWARSVDPNKRYLMSNREGLAAIGSASAVCMSCHDGSIATDTVGGVTGNVRIRNERALIGEGGDLSTDHPISVEYPTNDKGYWPENQVTARGTISLPGGMVECISCHDVHNESGYPYMLVEDNKGSNLCLSCHNK